jgi:hypothetical protein
MIKKFLPCLVGISVFTSSVFSYDDKAEIAIKSLPPEIAQLSFDYAHDLMSYFSWALDIRFTEAEQKRFISERRLEWVSGHNLWQTQYIGNYWALIGLPQNVLDGNKPKKKEELLDFIQFNTKQGVSDIIWIQKRLGDDEVDQLPPSKGRRSKFELLQGNPIIDEYKKPGIISGIDIRAELTYVDVANTIDGVSSMLGLTFTPEQREEFFERAKKSWRKSPDDWSTTAMGKSMFAYFHNTATYYVYKNDRPHNVAQIRPFG